MAQQICTLDNGLTLIVEEIDHVESVAYELFIPGGVLTDADQRLGASLILAELSSRGAGGLSSRELSEAFDALGIRHSESASQDRFRYRGSLLARNLEPALELLGKMILTPALPEEDIPSIKSSLLQDIASLQDNPMHRVMVELTARYFPEPYNRSSLGTIDGIKANARDSLAVDWEQKFKPEGSVLSIAGNVKTDAVQGLVNKIFGQWSGAAMKRPIFGVLPPHINEHILVESAQLQIALAYPSAKFGDPHYYAAKVADGVLSGGMSGRLFIEVREKQGLCYSVFSRHSGGRFAGTVTAYAGTTPDRAQQTLDSMYQVLRSLPGTISEEELARSKANLKASLIIGEESTGSRAASNAGDWWIADRVRALDEVAEAIESVSRDDIDSYLHAYPPDSFMLVTLGSHELEMPADSHLEVL